LFQSNIVSWYNATQVVESYFILGLEPIVVENILEGDQLRTDTATVQKIIQEKLPENILCICSTTSCFAPRAYDKIEELSRICKEFNVAHVINNAYGLQDSKISHLINESIRYITIMTVLTTRRTGRVDLFVQSTDKVSQIS
jgi:O-phospho-L-seryl-tRNASec:L-selenocysteinyl-tRNA synthase